MITIKIPKDIREYKEKVFCGLTVRQVISVILALIICIPTYIVGRVYISDDAISWVVISIALPIGALGFFKKNGMTFEKYVMVIIKQVFLYPQQVNYKSINFYRKLINQYNLQNQNNKSKKMNVIKHLKKLIMRTDIA